jgi:ferredoxin
MNMQPGKRPDFSDCSGCSLCLLVCPVWRAKRDLRFTPHGRAKALQNGVPAADLAASINSCTLCGACEPACPENIDLVGMTLGLRAELPKPVLPKASIDAVAADYLGQNVLLASPALLLQGSAIELAVSALTCVVAKDHGNDVALAIEAGHTVDAARREQLVAPLRRASQIIVADGLLCRNLKQWLPEKTVVSLGLALSRLPALRKKLQQGDLYVIEPRAYHAEQEKWVLHYDDLRHESGCAMNLDLQRIAIPATARSLRQRLGLDAVDDLEQTRWLLKGRRITRVVVESAEDMAVLQQVSGVPVVHLAELAN